MKHTQYDPFLYNLIKLSESFFLMLKRYRDSLVFNPYLSKIKKNYVFLQTQNLIRIRRDETN